AGSGTRPLVVFQLPGGRYRFYVVCAVSALRDTGWTAGLIHWPAVLGIISTSVLFAPLGAKLAKQLPSSVLKRIFSAVLLCVALYFFLR
ncbi:permease, partial [Methylophaga lonarensis MPL]